MLQAQSTLVGAAVVPPPAAEAPTTVSPPPSTRALSDGTTVPRGE
jgi:hypothetical protein